MTGHRFGWAALIGPPNAGKSTLMNAYLGQKVAIVSPRPQTTRNRITGILTTDEAQVVFLDTPGVHRRGGRLNRFLADSARNALAGADAILVVLDGALYAKRPGALAADLDSLAGPVAQTGRPVLAAVNKVDRIRDKAGLLPVLAALGRALPGAELFPVSALSGEGTDRLLERLVSLLPEAPAMFPEDQISTAPLRFMAAETVREKLFLLLRQELPYSVAVEVESWDEGEGRVDIAAVIYVCRENHKAMVIGKAGRVLKEVGTQARRDLEEMLETRVRLDLWVKVRSDWQEDPHFLRGLGLGI